jgi:RNA polymerase sigma factor (sigma-70 family)
MPGVRNVPYERDSIVTVTHTDPRSVRDAAVMTEAQHNPERFSAIFDCYYTEIFAYAAHRIGQDLAPDLVAETFLAAFQMRHRYDPDQASVRTWLYGIATNLIGKQRRSEIRALRAMSRLEVTGNAEGHDERVSSQVSAGALRASLIEALADLSDGERDVLLLVTLADLSYEEAGAALGISGGTVGSRLSRAKARVREALGGTNPMHGRGE